MKNSEKHSTALEIKGLFDQVLIEMHIEFNAYCQSRLAIKITENTKKAQSVHKIAMQIKKLLEANSEEAQAVIESIAEIKADLYGENMYGRLTRLKGVDVYHQILQTISNPQSDIEQHLLLQSVFIHRIYDKLSKKDVDHTHVDHQLMKQNLVEKLFPRHLFDDRGRSQSSNNLNDTRKVDSLKRLYSQG